MRVWNRHFSTDVSSNPPCGILLVHRNLVYIVLSWPWEITVWLLDFQFSAKVKLWVLAFAFRIALRFKVKITKKIVCSRSRRKLWSALVFRPGRTAKPHAFVRVIDALIVLSRACIIFKIRNPCKTLFFHNFKGWNPVGYNRIVGTGTRYVIIEFCFQVDARDCFGKFGFYALNIMIPRARILGFWGPPGFIHAIMRESKSRR